MGIGTLKTTWVSSAGGEVPVLSSESEVPGVGFFFHKGSEYDFVSILGRLDRCWDSGIRIHSSSNRTTRVSDGSMKAEIMEFVAVTVAVDIGLEEVNDNGRRMHEGVVRLV